MEVLLDQLGGLTLPLLLPSLLLLLLAALLDEGLAHEFNGFGLEVEVDELGGLVLLLAHDAGLPLEFHLLEGLSGDHMSAGPEGHELVEAVVLQLGDGAGDVVVAAGGRPLDDELGMEGWVPF